LLIMSHPYPHGASGSPLVDRAGRAVGIVVATTSEIGIAEPIDAVITLAERRASTLSRTPRGK
jgi:S1-C subfamily serine protease